jgi:hypothetical protein
MACIDVFNGDADGICALHQLRLTYPLESTLVTGTKRDTKLLERVQASPHDEVNVFDISMAQNRDALLHLLQLGVRVTYFDHHFKGTLTKHPGLTLVTDSAPDICTSALVDRYVGGEHRAWAVVGAFGDNMDALAQRLAEPLRLAADKVKWLKELGRALNYNAYGESEADLYFHPAQLYAIIKRYGDPLKFLEKESVFDTLYQGREDDMAQALRIAPQVKGVGASIYVLPDAPWSRRIMGEFANHLASSMPEHAYAVLTPSAADNYVVSVRAPLARPAGAEDLCVHFPTGGGRAAAAGINALPQGDFAEFSHRFFAAFSR